MFTFFSRSEKTLQLYVQKSGKKGREDVGKGEVPSKDSRLKLREAEDVKGEALAHPR